MSHDTLKQFAAGFTLALLVALVFWAFSPASPRAVKADPKARCVLDGGVR